MQVFINHGSGVPAWRQITGQVKNLVAAGALTLDEKLPSVRSLAVELGVNPVTTARAYRELEAEGVVRTHQGSGTFIAKTTVRFSAAEVRRRLAPLVDELLVQASQLGMSYDELIELLAERNSSIFKDVEKS